VSQIDNDRKVAIDPLLATALDTTMEETERWQAVRLLGDLGDVRAIDGLLLVHDQALADEEFVLSLLIVAALAKLGNHDKASTAIDLVAHEDPTVRVYVAPVLQLVVGPRLLTALETVVHDEIPEIRLGAVQALFYLGTIEAIDILVGCVEDEDPDVVNDARIVLRDVTADVIGDATIGDVRLWWEQRRLAFETGICYRLGQPIWLPAIFEEFAEPNRRLQIMRELHVITGHDFDSTSSTSLSDQQDAVLDRAWSWWEREGYRFQPGHLYKYGYAQDIARVY